MFGFKRKIAALEASMAALQASQNAIADALSKIAAGAGRDGGAESAITALGTLVESMATALSRSQESNLKLTDGLLQRAARQVTSSVAKEMAARSHEARARNKAEKENPGGLPAFVATCENCKAFLNHRHPVHFNDESKHTAERHEDLIRRAIGDSRTPDMFAN